MHKIRIPQIWSVGLLLIFILNISILPQSHSVLESDLQNQEGTLDPLQDENQRYQYDTSNHQFMPGKVMSPWTPPSLSGTGSELPVTEFADIIEADQQITLTYDSGTSSYSTDTASLVLPSPWEGTRHYTFVDNIDEDRVWVNNTDFSTTVDPWTGGDYDAPSYTNTFVEERVINPPGQSGNPAIHLRMNAAGNTRFDAGDACWFEEAVNITRGTAVYAWLELDYYAADGAGGTGEAPWGHTQLYIQIEGIDVWVTAFDDIPLEQTWYHLPPTSIDPSVFNTPNSQVDIRIGIRSVLTMSYTTVNYNEAYFDDVEIHLKAFARPSDLGLTMNGYTVEDGNITHPDGYTLTVGSYSSGAVSDLQDSDNSDLVINSSSNQIDLYTYYDLDTDGITEAEVTILELWIEAAFSTDITDGNLLVYDFSAGAWEKIHDGYTPNVVDEDWSWITTDPAQYIHDTEHYIRFRINGTHSSSFSLGIDYVHFAMTTNTANAAFGVGMYVQDKGTPWTSVDSPIAADFTFNYGASPPDLDVTVTLDCDQRFYAYRNTPDTLYEMNTGSLGTTYRVDNGTDVTWDFYVYISVPSGYTATEFTISSIPTDWSIGWVSEPQTPTVNNVGKTYLSAGVLTVPILPISPAPDGYWHIKATSPNYAQSLETQIEDPPSVWSPATTFRPTNTTRARGTILTSIPSPVNVTWFTPAGIEFYETHPPGAYTLTTGTSISGTVADLQSSDDADLVIESVGNVIDLYTSYDLDADGIAEADVTNLELWIEAAYNTSITDGDLYVRDFTGGTWEKINENYTPTTDQAWSWTTVNPGAYIDDTSHEIWFRVNGTHSGAFSIGIDYMHFQLTYLNYSGLSGVSGVVTTPSFTFPTSKTTAGEWTVLMKWINGTEVAYIAEPFKLNHPSELHSLNSPISAALGDTVTAWVRFNDSDNSQNILTGSVSTSGDGEFPAISFNPNSQFNRWEASFFVDTGFSVGTHTLPISGSAPYYNNPVSINFVIEVSDPSTTLTITKPMGGQTSIDPTQTLTFYLFYKDGGQGIPGLTQNNWTIDIQPGNPSSNLVIPNPTEVVGDPGNYTTTTQVGVDVDTYSITFTANGTHLGYAVASTFFVLSVVPVLTNFIVSSPGQTYQAKVNIWVNLTLHYETGGGVPIQGADVSEELGTPPELTVQLLSTQTNSSGDFNASVRASAPGAFSVTFKANKTAYADGFTYFTLATGAQPAHLVITNPGSPTQATIGVGQSF
ncbi:MAG: hypothetical protein ACE5I5_08430, partial [Candidatus Heimdallarchaeota archaeon]